jgi:DoxX-like family
VLFLLFDSLGKLLKVAPVVAGTAELGYPEGVIRPLGAVLLVCVVTYVIPRTAILGAVLLTGTWAERSRCMSASAARS